MDDPSDSVRNADELIGEVIESMTDRFMEERAGLEQQWRNGGDVTTEDMRLALTRYRDLFDRLMTVGGRDREYE